MSAIAESLRRQRLPLLTIAVVVAVGTIAWALVSRATSQHLTRPDYPVAAPAVEQAEWKIDYSAGGRFGKMTKKQSARYAAQKARAGSLVQALYDGIFLDPAGLKATVKESFAADAARSFDAERLGFPSAATDVKTIRRTARIALDARTAAHAIGHVAIVAEARLEKRTVQIKHTSTLWMERSDNKWRVIAFDVTQKPAK
ncbi:MAG: hypothetical protein KY391_01185 [Actinobacteria bacterium]|nr:hypothetical protein [Actinomycetota bacterium]